MKHKIKEKKISNKTSSQRRGKNNGRKEDKKQEKNKKQKKRTIKVTVKKVKRHSKKKRKNVKRITPLIVNKSGKNVRIKIVGVGGAGGNVISRMKNKKLEDVQFIAINTDLQGLRYTKADIKIQIGANTCRGLGAGMDPQIGQEAAEENREDIKKSIQNADLVFVTCGLGGGTGSGAAPLVASLAKQSGSLVIAVVTKPFNFEGEKRMEIAEEAWQKLFNEVDAIVTVPNDRVFNIINKDTPILQAFSRIDDILFQGVQGISNLITYPGLINLDFANIKTTLSNAGSSLMGIGKARGTNRAQKAARLAINSPLLDISIEGATKVLFNIAGGRDMSLVEIHNAARIITESIDKEARVIFGTSFDKTLKKGEIKVTVIAGGFEGETQLKERALPLEMKVPIEDIEEENQKKSEEEIMSSFTTDEELEIPTFLRQKKKGTDK